MEEEKKSTNLKQKRVYDEKLNYNYMQKKTIMNKNK